MKNKRILISGAGIAGPALALSLAGRGFEVTVVEKAKALRAGGQAVDFRGPVHRAVLERLGLWEAVQARRTSGSEITLLDPQGRPAATLPAVMMSGDVEILRGDLCRLLVERTEQSATYRFGDRVSALSQSDAGVEVAFASGRTERYDLVVGADGLHSGVRALAFGEEAKFLRHHGYRLATFTMPNTRNLARRAITYTVPGRAATLSGEGPERARALFIFEGGPLVDRGDLEGLRREVAEAYRGVGWEVPRLLAELPRAADLYVDQIATVALPAFSRRRVVLLGDAAYGGTLGGQGTPLAIVGAHVLAGELAAANGDHPMAFARYEAQMRPYALGCQKGAERAGSFFAPRTRLGLLARNLFYRAFTSRLLIGQFERMVKASAGAFELPQYG